MSKYLPGYPESGHYSIQAACLKGADIVEKVLSGLRTKFFRAQLGEASEALNRLRESDREPAIEIVVRRAWCYCALGRAHLRLGRLDEAQRLGDRAVESSSSQPGFAAHALHLLGDIATHPDRFDAESGEARYRRALALAEPRGMRLLMAHCHLSLGKLFRRTGKRKRAHQHLTTAAAMYREMGVRFWLEQAEAELRQLQ